MANNYSKKTREILKDAGVIVGKETTDTKTVDLIKEAEQERRLKELTAKNMLFLDTWLKTGNPIQSYKKAYGVKEDFRAVERSAVLISKYRGLVISALKEKMGVNEVLYFERLMAMLKAKKVVFTKLGGKHIIPDNTARIKALQMLGEALEVNNKRNGSGDNTNIGIGTVNIYKDKGAGVWSVNDSIDGEIVR